MNNCGDNASFTPAPGGGGSSYTLLGSTEIEITDVTSTAKTFGEIVLDERVWTSEKIIYVRIRDKAGYRNQHLFGCDYFFINQIPANSIVDTLATANKLGIGYGGAYSGSEWNVYSASGNANSGIYLSYPTSESFTIKIGAKTNSSVGIIDGTFTVDVYALDWPDDISPFLRN